MTTYTHTITFNDSEIIMLEEALKLMVKNCHKKLDKGVSSPYWAHKNSAKNVLDRLFDDTSQSSGNNFFR
jgi:hypothetical protein